MISRRHKRVRSTIIFLYTNFLTLMTILIILEILLLFLGLNNIYIPLPQGLWNLLDTIRI